MMVAIKVHARIQERTHLLKDPKNCMKTSLFHEKRELRSNFKTTNTTLMKFISSRGDGHSLTTTIVALLRAQK